MSESKGPSTEAIALYTNVFGCVPDTEALEAGDVWEIAHIDAALRRAKAEVLAEMKLEANGSRAKSYIVETPYNEGHDAAIDNFVKWLDARAAQIEEGE